jgi:hypothetical protein
VTSKDWAMSYGWAEPVGNGRVSGMMEWGFLAWGMVATLVLLLATLAASRLARRRFWCAQAGSEVDVEFEEHGVPGLRRFIAVRRCSAFTPSTVVTCRRSCLRGAVPERPAVTSEAPRSGQPGRPS